MVIDPTISIGNLITLGGYLLGGFAFLILMHYRLKGVEGRLDGMKTVLIDLAVQDERITAQDRRIDDLQHGRGFILEGMGGANKVVEPLSRQR